MEGHIRLARDYTVPASFVTYTAHTFNDMTSFPVYTARHNLASYRGLQLRLKVARIPRVSQNFFFKEGLKQIYCFVYGSHPVIHLLQFACGSSLSQNVVAVPKKSPECEPAIRGTCNLYAAHLWDFM